MQLDHINIVTPDLDATSAFLCDVVGFSVGPRPNFSRKGVWLYGEEGGVALIHITLGESRDGPTGPLDHVAFRADDKNALIARLEAHGIEYTTQVVPDRAIDQIFFRAPFGLRIEVDFHPKG